MVAPAEQSHEPLRLGKEERRTIFYLKSDLPFPDPFFRSLKMRAEGELTGRLPAIASLAERLGFGRAVTPLAAGSFHVVHQISRGDKAFVLRSTVPGLFIEDRSLLFEQRARGWLGSLGLAALVPQTETVQFRSADTPFDFAILALADGIVLRDLGDAVLDEQPGYLRALGEALRSIHRVEGHGAGLLDCSGDQDQLPSGVHTQWQAYLELRLGDHIRACMDAGYINSALADKILNLFRLMQPAVANRPLRLLHGDPGTHNVCVDPATQRVTAVLDWEDTLVGDPLFDLAMASSFQPERRLPALLAGYGLHHPTAEERALIALYFLRIALSKTTHRLRFGIVDLPDRTPGHHRIYRGVDELSRLI